MYTLNLNLWSVYFGVLQRGNTMTTTNHTTKNLHTIMWIEDVISTTIHSQYSLFETNKRCVYNILNICVFPLSMYGWHILYSNIKRWQQRTTQSNYTICLCIPSIWREEKTLSHSSYQWMYSNTNKQILSHRCHCNVIEYNTRENKNKNFVYRNVLIPMHVQRFTLIQLYCKL